MFNMTVKRFIYSLLVITMIFSLAACDNKKLGSATNSKVTKVVDSFGKYDPPIEITYSLRSAAAQKFLPGESYQDNTWTREIEKQLGIKLKIAWDADGSTDMYVNKLNICIASNDLPDFFSIESKQYTSAVQAGLLYDMTDIFENYASDGIKKSKNAFPEAFDAAKINGKLYALPELGSASLATGTMNWWIREDWMKKLNLSAPKTFNDILNIAEAFVKNDPDGNGKADTYGMALQKDLYGAMGVIDGVGSAYHALLEKHGIWYEDDAGKIVYGAVQPQVKDALKALQDMYNNGLIDKEFGVKDANKISEDINNNKIGLLCGPNWHCYYPFYDVAKKDPNAIFKAYPVASSDNKPAKVGAYWPVWQYFGVNAKCQNPEAIVKIMNLQKKIYNEDSSEEVAQKYQRKNDIEISNLCPFKMGDPGSGFRSYESIRDAINNKDDGNNIKPAFKTTYNNIMKYINNGDVSQYGVWAQMAPEGSMGICYNYEKDGLVVTTKLRGADTPSQVKYRATLEKMELEAFSDIIMGKSLDRFDKFVAEWKDLGGDKITEEMNSRFGNK